MIFDRRGLLQAGGAAALVGCSPQKKAAAPSSQVAADHVIEIVDAKVEVAPGMVVQTTTYNGQFPGPLLRMKEGVPVTIDIRNKTAKPEQLHWHGQKLPVDVDGSAEEGTPYIPAHGSRRISFTPGPSGFRFYHTHVIAGPDMTAGQYGGQVGPVYIEPKANPGRYDQEVFLTLKEFGPTLSHGGDMDMHFLEPGAADAMLKATGEAAMKASLAKGAPKGYEVGYKIFTVNGRTLGHSDPIRVQAGQRVLFHVLNGSAGEIRSLALPGHTFHVVALDGNPLPAPVEVPVLWIGTAERVSAVVEMQHPGVWVLGDLADDDRGNGMGIVIEYAGAIGDPKWMKPPKGKWNYIRFGRRDATAPEPDETFDMTFAKDNAAVDGFNRWTINGVSFPDMGAMGSKPVEAMFKLHQGRRYRLRMHNASDDIHPVHLHRHSFELTRIAGQPAAGVIKDVVMLNGYQSMDVDFVADNPGRTLFHCHQQLHMDFGFMCLFDYV
jgi:FtsP/CotA-like multicopper oxidase with cupredoxin domain